MAEFNYEINNESETSSCLTFKGFLNEDAVLPEIASLKGFSELRFDFENFNNINSIGIKKWILFVEGLEKECNCTIRIHNCSVRFLELMGMVEGLCPSNAIIESVNVPLYCEKCELEFKTLRTVDYIQSNLSSVVYDLQQLDCKEFPRCKETLVIDCDENMLKRVLKS